MTVGELVSAYGFGTEQTTTSKPATDVGPHVNGSAIDGDMHINGTASIIDDSAVVNGTTHSQVDATSRDTTSIKTVEQLYTALTTLIRAGFLIKANPEFFQTGYDLQRVLEKTVQEENFTDGKITGPKASQLYSTAVRERKRKQRESDFDVDGILDSEQKPSKRQKTKGALTNGHRHHLEVIVLQASLAAFD